MRKIQGAVPFRAFQLGQKYAAGLRQRFHNLPGKDGYAQPAGYACSKDFCVVNAGYHMQGFAPWAQGIKRPLPLPLCARLFGAEQKRFPEPLGKRYMRGFRILREDLCLMVPCASPVDGAVMLVEHNGHRYLRKIKKQDALTVLLQSYDREYASEPCALPDANFLGRAVKVEFSL